MFEWSHQNMNKLGANSVTVVDMNRILVKFRGFSGGSCSSCRTHMWAN